MASCKEISLRDLFSQYTDTGQAVCVKNVPVTASKDSLICFIEVILKSDVIAIYFPLPDVKDCCVAIMEEPVTDLTSYTKVLQGKLLEGNKVSISPLGPAEGLFIRQVPEEVSDQFLELYFESPRSCGEEECVGEVRSCICCQDRMVVVVIKDTEVVRRIINKTSHPNLDKYHLYLESYFPTFHDEIFTRHGETKSAITQGSENELLYSRNATTGASYRELVTNRLDSTTVGGLSGQGDSLNIDNFIPNRPLTDAKLNRKFETIQPTLNVDQELNDNAGRNHALSENKQSHTYQKPSTTKLRIFSEDSDNEVAAAVKTEPESHFDHRNAAKQDALFTRSGEIVKDEFSDVLPNFTNISNQANTCQAPFNTDVRRKPIKAVKPFCSPNNASSNTTDDMEDRSAKPTSFSFQPRSHSNAAKYNNDPQCSPANLHVHEEENRKPKWSAPEIKSGDNATVDLPKTSIVLLKINGFTKRCGDCKVTLTEKQCRVRFEGDDDSVGQAKIKMYETLQNAVEITKVLPKHHVQYINESQGYLRTQLTKRKIGAALKIDVGQSTVQCLAFTDKQAERGLDFVTKELISKKITIREGQSQSFECADWDNILKNLQRHVQVTVVKGDSTVDIVAYNEDSVNMAHKKIIQYLKESQPKDKTEIVLKDATARCFKKHFLDELKLTIRKQNGDIKWYNEGNETLKIAVEGDPSLSNLVQDKIKLVWHEKIDFKRITTDVNELWLLMKGLATQKAKDLLDKFERDHACFIEIRKEGEISLPVVSIQRIDNGSSDSRISVAHTLDREDEFDRTPKRRQSHEIEKFQPGLTDDEALQMALIASMSESMSEPTLHSQDYEFPRSNTTGNLRSYGETKCFSDGAEAYRDMKEFSRQFRNTKVTIKQGAIASDRISSQHRVAKVNVFSPSQDIEKESIISKAFVRAGGQELVQKYESAKNQLSAGAHVVVTQGCKALGCDYVLHVTLKKSSRPEAIISQVMKECFQLCANYGCSCIAFPPLGVGRLYQYQPSVVAEGMVDCILRETQSGSLKEIVIIIYDKDEENYQVFESELKDKDEADIFDDGVSYHFPAQQSMFGNRMETKPVTNYYGSVPQGGPLVTGSVQRPLRSMPATRVSNKPRPPLRKTVSEDINISPPVRTQRVPVPSPFGQPVARLQPMPIYQRPSRDSSTVKPSPFHQKIDSSAKYDSAERDTDSRSHKYSRKSQEDQTRRAYHTRPKERSPPEVPVAKYKVKVFSRDKNSCERARNDLGRQLKSQFLYEVKLERRGKLSTDCKKRIRDSLRKWNVKSFQAPGTKNYVIKGEEKSVTEANAEILKIILEFKDSETSFESQRAKRRDLRSKPNEYVRHMALEHDPEIPSYWKNWKSGSPIRIALTAIKTLAKDFVTESLDENDPVYRAIINLIKKTWDGSKVGQGKDAKGLETLNYSNIRVTKIRRVENLQLFDKYLNRRKHIFIGTHKRQKSSCTPIAQLPGSSGSALTEELQRCRVYEDELCSEVNEHFFFHGTTPDIVDVICDGGLDSRLGSHQAMYGAGIYGAESPTKADQYADPKDKRTKDGKKMFLMRMVLGESFLCTDQNPHKYRRPPCANTKCLRDDCKDKSHGSFDSVIGQSGRLFREFVVYQPEQCYPEYIISYDRV